MEAASDSAPNAERESIRHALRRLDWRDWSLWSAAFVILLLLLAALASFAVPGAEAGIDLFGFERLQISVRALLGLILLFATFTTYQQVQIHRLRGRTLRHMAWIAATEQRARSMERLALQDALTGLYNRHFAQQHLVSEIARALRLGYALTFAMLDLDGFKQINDTWGHAAGDRVLEQFAGQMQRTFRTSDMIMRLGGDEFLVVLPECSKASLDHALGRLKGLTVAWEGSQIAVSFSAGCAECRTGDTMESLLKRADQDLYWHKGQGRGRAEAVHS